MIQIDFLNNLFLSELKDKTKELYEPLIEQFVITPKEAEEEIHQYHAARRPGLLDVYSRFSQHWQALQEVKTCRDEHIPYLVQRYASALSRSYDKAQLGTDYYLNVWRTHAIGSQEWQMAKRMFIDRWERVLDDLQYAEQLNYIRQLTEEYYRLVKQQASQLANKGSRGVDASPRLSWLAAKQDPAMREILRRLASVIAKNPIARDLLNRLGREDVTDLQYYRAQNALQMQHTLQHAAQSDIVGIKDGRHLGALLPSEYARMADPILEDHFLMRYAEGHLQEFDSTTLLPDHAKATDQPGRDIANPSGKGPFVACVDCSGSMAGNFEQIAKALVLVVALCAERRKQKCRVILFSDQIEEVEFENLGEGLPKLEHLLTMSFHGGTDASLAFSHAMSTLERDEFTKADLLLLSDFQMDSPPMAMHQRLIALKQRGTRYYAIAFGDDANEYYLSESDHSWHYR